MNTLNSTTTKLVKATERLLQELENERTQKKVEKEESDRKIKDLEEQVQKLKSELDDAKASENQHISNPQNQSHNTAAIQAQNIDALVEEIDTCLNLLKI